MLKIRAPPLLAWARAEICKVYEVGTVDAKPYIAMELIEGQTLDRSAAQLLVSDKLQIIKTCAEALHVAHEQGIIHRDIKPANIMVERTAGGGLRPVIMDFGLARESGEAKGLTESGTVMGTPAYMSPEQARGEARLLDRRSDVYSLGAALYDVLTGHPPFEDQTVMSILLKVMTETPRPLRALAQELPEAVELIVSKCLNKEPAQRYPTALALAEDIARYLNAHKVQARRLSYTYRLWFWARQNKTLAVVAATLMISILTVAGLLIRSRLVALRRDRQAREQQELARFIGQTVKDLEWVARTAYLLPLHDTRYEQGLVQHRMAEIEAELRKRGNAQEALGAYARGRGHLALHNWKQAREELTVAEKLGFKEPELDYALGRALGALYSQALDEARKSGDKSFFEKRKAELDAELLQPTLRYLERSRALTTVSAAYVEGLVAYYQAHHDIALQRADLAKQQAPWLYEAVQLGGDVLLAQARAQRDRGEHDQAEKSFQDAVTRYEQAADIGRSDHEVHEALAEAFIRWEELDCDRGKDPASHLKQALAAADRALVAAPVDSHGHTKKAYAYHFQSAYVQHRAEPAVIVKLRQTQIVEGEQALRLHPKDAYAHEAMGIAYFRLAEKALEMGQETQALLDSSYQHFELAVQIAPRFAWAYNDFAQAVLTEAKARNQKMVDPIDATRKAIRLAEKAAEIDPGYLHAYNTMTMAHLLAATWSAEHGKDPASNVRDGLAAAQKIMSINSKYSLIYGNVGLLYAYQGYYDYIASVSSDDASRKSLQAFGAMSKLSGGIPDIYAPMVFVYYIVAKSDLSRKMDITKPLADGLAVAQQCLREFPLEAYCQDMMARLLGAAAEWRQAHGQPFAAELEQASRLSKQAMAKSPDDQDTLLAGAEIARLVARAELLRGRRPLAEIQRGLAAVDRAAAGTVGLPRGAVLRGALLLLQAKAAQDPAVRRDALLAAQRAFADGFARNPLLARHHPGVMEEIEGMRKGR